MSPQLHFKYHNLLCVSPQLPVTSTSLSPIFLTVVFFSFSLSQMQPLSPRNNFSRCFQTSGTPSLHTCQSLCMYYIRIKATLQHNVAIIFTSLSATEHSLSLSATSPLSLPMSCNCVADQKSPKTEGYSIFTHTCSI